MADYDRAIAPGQEGKITLRLNTSRRQGKVTKSAAVMSNDPNKPTARIMLSCFVKEHISIKPNNRFNLTGYEGDDLSQKLTITAIEGQEFDITEVTTDLTDKVQYKLETVQKGKEYSLEVKSLIKEEGFIRGKVELRTTSKTKPLIVLPVSIRIQGEVEVRPASLYFGKINSAAEPIDPAKLTKSVVLRTTRVNDLDIKKIKESSNWIKAKIDTMEKGVQYTVAITLDRDKIPKGKFDEKIEIKTNKKDEPLIVSIKGEVM